MSHNTRGKVNKPDLLKPFLKPINTVAIVCKKSINIDTNEASCAQIFEKISHHAFREMFNKINNMMTIFSMSLSESRQAK